MSWESVGCRNGWTARWMQCALLIAGSLLTETALSAGNAESPAEPLPDYYFDMTLDELLNTEVTISTKQAQKVSEAPSIVTVITQRQIAESGARTLQQLVESVPGFTTIKRQSNERVLVARGLALRDGVLVQVDGVTVNDAFSGGFDFYDRPIHDIERIEIVRGPGSVLYGGYALSAVIQLFTATSTGHKGITVKAGSGSHDTHSIALNGEHELSVGSDRVDVVAGFSASDTAGDTLTIKQDSLFTPEIGTFLPPLTNPSLTPAQRQVAEEAYTGHVKVAWSDLTLSYTMTQLISEPMLSHVGVVVEEGKHLKDSIVHRFSGQHHWVWSDAFKINTTLFWVRNEHKLLGQSQPPQFLGDEDQNGLNEEWPSGVIENFEHVTRNVGIAIEADCQLTEQHTLNLGFGWDQIDVVEVSKSANISLAGRGPRALFPVQDMTHEYLPDAIDRNIQSLYVQDLWQLSGLTSVTLGLRYSDFSDFGTTINPRAGLVHRFNDNWYGKLLYGEAFKPPGFIQLFDLTPTQSPFRVQGNTDLDATEIKTEEIQLGYQWSDKAHVTLSVFQNKTKNEIFFNDTPGIEQWQNGAARSSEGAELDIKSSLSGVDYLFANYSYQHTRGIAAGPQADIHPPHRVNVGGYVRVGQRYGIYTELNYYGSPARESADTRDRIAERFNLNITFHMRDIVDNLDMVLRAENLLDDTGHYETPASLRLRDDIPVAGRAFFLTLEYHLSERAE